jgi:hypothetical protein
MVQHAAQQVAQQAAQQSSDQGGLDPTLAAILPLVGVAVGAALGGLARWFLDRGAESRRFKAAVWMLRDDLERMVKVLDPDQGPTGPLGVRRSELDADERLALWLTSAAWDTERSTLALGLQDHEDLWDEIRWTMLQAAVMRRLAADSAGRESPDAEAITRRVATEDELLTRVRGVLHAVRAFA